MKEFRKFFIGQLLVVAVLITLLFAAAFSNKNHQISTVDFNDYIETIKENWDSLDTLRNNLNGTDVMILDKDNRVVYSSSEAAFTRIKSPLDAMSNNMLTFPINDDDVFLGTLVIKDPSKIKYDHAMRRTLVVSVFVIMIMLFS